MQAFKRVFKLTCGKVGTEWAKQFNFSTGFKKRAKCDPNDAESYFPRKVKKSHSDKGFAPRPPFIRDDRVAALCSARHSIEAFFKQKNL